MIVRAAEEVDIEPLTTMWFDGWHEAHASIVPESLVRLRTRESFCQRLRFELGSVRLIGAPAAPLGFTMIRGEELYQFYVGASVRGTAIAAMLMKDVEGQMVASGVSIAWLACAVGNTRAARFYEKSGWRRTATVTVASDTSVGPFPLQVWTYEKELIGPRVFKTTAIDHSAIPPRRTLPQTFYAASLFHHRHPAHRVF